MLHFILIFLSIADGYKRRSPVPFKITAIFASKHHASYGVFIDSMNVLQEKKVANFQSNFNLADYQNESAALISGVDLRKNREKNLRKVKSSQDPVIPFKPLTRTPKKGKDEIEKIVECLNMCFEIKDNAELSEEERVGLINWDKFDEVGRQQLGEVYEQPGFKSKLRNWINFHRKKGDIAFTERKFVWTKL